MEGYKKIIELSTLFLIELEKEKGIMRKKYMALGISICLAIGMVCSGCGNQEKDSADVGITIWTNLENEAKTLQEYAKKYEEKTGKKVEVIHETADIQQFAQATKSTTGPDGIYGLANDQLANYIDAGLVEAVPENIFSDDDYVKASTIACYSDGVKYGVPIAVETNALFYNTDKIKKVPKTWEDLIEVAKKQGGIQFEATSIYYDLGFLRAFDSYIFKYQNGAYNVNDIGIGNEGAVKAYDFINRLANEYQFFGSDITSDTAKGNFQSGKTAFYIGGPWDIDGFRSANVPFQVAVMPTLNGKHFVTPVGIQVGFVSAKSDAKDEVWKFYQYLMEETPEKLYEVGGRIPAQLKAQKAIQKDDVTASFIEQAAYGEPMPTVSEMGQVWTPFSDNMKLMLNGQCTPEEAASYIETQLKEGIELMNSGK